MSITSRTRSRSPTLGQSVEGSDVEKLPRTLQNDEQARHARLEKSSWSEQEQRDPFGDDNVNGVKYKTLHWWQCSMIMIAETISLGILSLPSVLSEIGMVGGALLIVVLGVVTTYSGYVLGQFKAKYPWVHNMGDAFYVLFRPLGPRAAAVGREFGGAAQTISLIFSMASHILTWTICMNTLTNSATCTIVWAVIGLALFWLCDLPRTLLKVSWLSCVSFASILSAVMVVMIALGVTNPSDSRYNMIPTAPLPFRSAFLSVTNIVFAYAGHVAFFSFISEMKEPKDFPKALVLLQVSDTLIYLIVAVVCYAYAGVDVESPALGSAGGVVGKVAWGLSIPTIIIAGVIYGHVAAKYIYIRLFRDTKHMHDRGLTELGTWSWAVITLVLWLIAWIISASIPNFNSLLGLIASIFVSWFAYGISGVFWLFINRGQYTKNWKKASLTAANILLVAIGGFIFGAGLYASGYTIQHERAGASWTCASNAQH